MNEDFLQFIRRYATHQEWKPRALICIFLGYLYTFTCSGITEGKYLELDRLLWSLHRDPESRVVELFLNYKIILSMRRWKTGIDPTIPISLSDLETLFLTLSDKGFPQHPGPFPLSAAENIRAAIKEVVVKLKVEKLDTLLPFIDHYLPHQTWELRVCAIIFLAILLDRRHWETPEREGDMRSKMKFEWLGYSQFEAQPYLDQVTARFWGVLGAPDPCVLEYWARSLYEIRRADWNIWLNPESGTFASLPLSAAQRQAIDVTMLSQTIPLLSPEARPECFWATTCLVAERVRRGEETEMTPVLLQLLAMALQEGGHVWRKEGRGYCDQEEGELVAELIELIGQISPSHITRDVVKAAIDPSIPANLDQHLIRLRDLELLVSFLTDYYSDYGSEDYDDYVEHISKDIDTLFQLALEAEWDEGAQFLLAYVIGITARYYRWGPKGMWAEQTLTKTTTKLLKQYVRRNLPWDRPLLERLAEWYKASLDLRFLENEEGVKWFKTSLISVGQLIEQQ
ncbi:MAG: hypothetical protein ACE5R6_07220 [Candidatus Heimdallarchaeota archaeon]